MGITVNTLRVVFYVVMLGLVGTGVGMYAMAQQDTIEGIDQSRLCVVESDQDAMQCESDSMMLARFTQGDPAFLPFRVLNTAALYCNTNHQILTSNVGVFCVMTHDRIPSVQQDGSASETNQGGGLAAESEG